MLSISGQVLLTVGSVTRFKSEAIAQCSQCVGCVINGFAFVSVVIGHRKQFAISTSECDLSFVDPERQRFPVCLGDCCFIQLTPALNGGRRCS